MLILSRLAGEAIVVDTLAGELIFSVLSVDQDAPQSVTARIATEAGIRTVRLGMGRVLAFDVPDGRVAFSLQVVRSGGKARIGVIAPDETPVHRLEIHRAIRARAG